MPLTRRSSAIVDGRTSTRSISSESWAMMNGATASALARPVRQARRASIAGESTAEARGRVGTWTASGNWMLRRIARGDLGEEPVRPRARLPRHHVVHDREQRVERGRAFARLAARRDDTLGIAELRGPEIQNCARELPAGDRETSRLHEGNG